MTLSVICLNHVVRFNGGTPVFGTQLAVPASWQDLAPDIRTGERPPCDKNNIALTQWRLTWMHGGSKGDQLLKNEFQLWLFLDRNLGDRWNDSSQVHG
jgi:hypothetical protein